MVILIGFVVVILIGLVVVILIGLVVVILIGFVVVILIGLVAVILIGLVAVILIGLVVVILLGFVSGSRSCRSRVAYLSARVCICCQRACRNAGGQSQRHCRKLEFFVGHDHSLLPDLHML